MKKIELSCGVTLEVSEVVLNDMELVDDLAEAENDNPLAVSRILLKVLGKEQRKKLYDAIRTPDGRVPTEKISPCIEEIFKAFGEQGKN